MLKLRIISGVLLGLLALFIFWFGDPWFSVIVSAVSIITIYEFQRIVNPVVWPKMLIPAILGGLLLNIRFYIGTIFSVDTLITLVVFFSLLWLLRLPRNERSFNYIAFTIAGTFYIGWLLGYWIILRNYSDGKYWSLLALFTIAATDISAFFFGRSFGKNRIAPSISPSKTWEGALGGIVGATVISLTFCRFSMPSLPPFKAIIFGFIVACAAQIGDLIESIIKRNANLKDSSNLIPGHGGFLDRLDSVLFGGFIAYYLILFFDA